MVTWSYMWTSADHRHTHLITGLLGNTQIHTFIIVSSGTGFYCVDVTVWKKCRLELYEWYKSVFVLGSGFVGPAQVEDTA